MLALGDALAMFMMKRRDFSGADFKTNHPGGNIGRRALSVREMLLKNELNGQKTPPSVFLSTLFSEASTSLLCSEVGIASVIDDNGRIIDILSSNHIGLAMILKFSDHWTVGQVLERLKMKQPEKFMLELEDFTTLVDGQISNLVAKMNRTNLPGTFVINDDGYVINYIPLKTCLEAGISSNS